MPLIFLLVVKTTQQQKKDGEMCDRPAVQLLVSAAAETIGMDFDIMGKRYPPIY